uniref:GapR-like DNA-binding domain-containing protein n=1 Tax=viral metagenome TaxID=1070528 RepID=A0A6M3JHV7_9ZZZZ
MAQNDPNDQIAKAMRDRHEDQQRKQGKPPMKHDPEFQQAADQSYRVTADELRQFIERFERLEMEKKDIADQQKEVMAEAKGRGYDTKIIRKIIALRKKSSDEIAEEEAILEMYKEALGMTQLPPRTPLTPPDTVERGHRPVTTPERP